MQNQIAKVPFRQSVSIELNKKKRLLAKAELSIWLDSYDDIYSDFDSRSYSERALSDDFINEAKKMAREKMNGVILLKLLMPGNKRHANTEEIVVKNLHAHFHRSARQQKHDLNRVKQNGILWTIVGLLIMIISAYIAGKSDQAPVLNIVRVILEPAGWFFTWAGLDNIFSATRKMKTEFNFMNRMAHAEIVFSSI